MARFLKTLAIGLLSTVILVGCNNTKETSENTQVSGRVVINGSTSMESLTNALIDAYSKENPNVEVLIEATGSNSGVEAVFSALSDIGNVSRELKTSDTSNGLVSNVIAIDGIGVIVDASNPVNSLTLNELVAVYDGTITNWLELGGEDLEIITIGRDASSGTRSAFEEVLNIKSSHVYSYELETNDMITSYVQSMQGAIGYVSLDALSGSSAKALDINGYSPTTSAIGSGGYKIARPYVMATKGNISSQSEAVQDFFAFVYSDKGKAIVEANGLINPS